MPHEQAGDLADMGHVASGQAGTETDRPQAPNGAQSPSPVRTVRADKALQRGDYDRDELAQKKDAIMGTVKMVAYDRKFGFIAGEDGQDYFFHAKACDESLKGLQRGDGVMFQTGSNARGPLALRVTAFPNGRGE